MYLPLESLLERQLHDVFTEIYLKKGNCKKIVKNSHINQFEQNFNQKKDKDLYYNTMWKSITFSYYLLHFSLRHFGRKWPH